MLGNISNQTNLPHLSGGFLIGERQLMILEIRTSEETVFGLYEGEMVFIEDDPQLLKGALALLQQGVEFISKRVTQI
jgi:hypothetical protein